MSKAILIVILGSIVLLGIANLSTNKYVNSDTDNSVNFYADARAKNIARSVTQILLSEIADSFKYVSNGTKSIDLLGGHANYSVSKVYFKGDSLLKIYATSDYFGRKDTVTAYCSMPGGWVPPFVRGAWTANANLNNTISDMYIDGRNYKLDGTIVPTTGVYGVSSSVPFVNTQFAKIGGTKNGVDYPMTYPQNAAVIELYNWNGSFPQTPDAILGYPEGTLKSVAQTHVGGSQYLLNPIPSGKSNFISGLTYPLSGVTYIEITNGTQYEIQLEKNGNKGLLVIHGPNRSSIINGVKYNTSTSDGLFTGLLVTDYSFHHHLNILGAVLQLSPNLETSKNCNGNLDHWVHYSSQAIINATEIVAKNTQQISYKSWGKNNVYAGMGDRRFRVKYWYE